MCVALVMTGTVLNKSLLLFDACANASGEGLPRTISITNVSSYSAINPLQGSYRVDG